MGWLCRTYGCDEGVCRVLVGEVGGKRPLGRPRHSWKDIIKMDLQEVGREGIDLIDLTQNRDFWRAVVNEVLDLRVPLNAENFSPV